MKIHKISTKLLLFCALGLFFGCEELEKFEPIGENSIPDATPPEARFSFAQGEGEDFLTYTFLNQSNSATTYAWDFASLGTSMATDPSFTFPDEGQYEVTLTASDKLGAMSTFSQTVEVVEPEVPAAKLPNILENSFEDGTLEDGAGDGRDSWRNDLGGVIQITSSPVVDGSQAAKFPAGGDRVAFQSLELTPDTDYILKYFYTLKTSPEGSVTVSIVPGSIYADVDEAKAAAIASSEGTDQESASTYTEVSLPFNTGDNSTLSILITNMGAEARVDLMTLELVEL